MEIPDIEFPYHQPAKHENKHDQLDTSQHSEVNEINEQEDNQSEHETSDVAATESENNNNIENSNESTSATSTTSSSDDDTPLQPAKNVSDMPSALLVRTILQMKTRLGNMLVILHLYPQAQPQHLLVRKIQVRN